MEAAFTPFELLMGPDRVLRGDYWPSSDSFRGLLIVCHGFRAFKDALMFPYIAQRFSMRGLDVINLNFSHNGVGPELTYHTEMDKFSVNTYSTEIEDLAFLIRRIRDNNGIQPLTDRVREGDIPIFLLGHSRGGFNGYIAAVESPSEIAGVVTWNGHFDDLEAIFTRTAVKEMRETGNSFYGARGAKHRLPLDVELLHDLDRNAERFDVYRHAAAATVPMLFVQGTEDFVFIQRASAKLAKMNPLFARELIAGANHTFGIAHPFAGTTAALEEAIDKTYAFIASVMPCRS
jgi:pimeloyl-ACP methyl ester carboxylesterase